MQLVARCSLTTPTAGSVDLAGILLKTAAYGLLRFGIPLFPHASADFAPVAMWLGIIEIVYGAILAFSQTDIKRLVAYTSISHMGFVVIALYAGTATAIQLLCRWWHTVCCGTVYHVRSVV